MTEARSSEDFAVPFVHRLRFTQDVLRTDQHVLADVLESSPGRPARIQFWLDENVAEIRPELRQQLRAFADSRPAASQLAPLLRRGTLLVSR